MNKLNKDLEDFNFRKRKEGEKNKCGRDFLYYVLDFYNSGKCKTLNSLDRELGFKAPFYLAWSLIQFANIGRFLKQNNLKMTINNFKIKSFFDFFSAISYSKSSYEEAIHKIEESINKNIACGIDISIGFGGLLDHVMFVYGYDEENLYVIDAVFVEGLGYKKFSDNEHLKKLPKKTIADRWSRFGRFWIVESI
jgi:hypothetical protein